MDSSGCDPKPPCEARQSIAGTCNCMWLHQLVRTFALGEDDCDNFHLLPLTPRPHPRSQITTLCRKIETKEMFACKSISKQRKIITAQDAEDVRREIGIMYHLNGHPNICELKGVYEDKANVHLVRAPLTGSHTAHASQPSHRALFTLSQIA